MWFPGAVDPDEYGLVARFGGEIPPGVPVRRNPGDESCLSCMTSPTGFCPGHREFRVTTAPVPAAEADEDGERDEVRL
jgi:hypothetical protein